MESRWKSSYVQLCSVVMDLRLRIKDLESQVEHRQEEAARLVKHQATRNPLSIADEVELQVSLATVPIQKSSKREAQDDEEKTSVKAFSKSQCHSDCWMLLGGALTTGILVIGGGVVLVSLDNWSYNAYYFLANNLWKAVHNFFLHYCDIQYKCLPPV
ncbi:hypothetical protein NHX12_011080 [Muraenolepis orangiensis]|uniref:Uncharacterized protein n=1 Tax=Muraenolepis orangiensis TaxID=630683 RepID=A0A9Q0DFF9_9TELE|nr:hypothetical protein NHX12_011080 [Muraenolepis orangiensis]